MKTLATQANKSPGQTLAQVVVDSGKAERSAGCSYVALSRVRSLQNVVLQPCNGLLKTTIDREKQAITGKAQRRRAIKKSISNHSTSISANNVYIVEVELRKSTNTLLGDAGIITYVR